jgi:hypothetical protein
MRVVRNRPPARRPTWQQMVLLFALILVSVLLIGFAIL